jgi:hypothetical protein
MTRRRTTRHGLRLWQGNAGGYCYQHVQAIIVAIDQYAEKALGNREFFLNKPALEVEGTITFPDSYRSKRERKLSVA